MKRFTLGIIFLMLVFGTSAAILAQGRPAHNVNSHRPMYLTDAKSGKKYNKLKGCVIVSWQEKTPYAFVNAKLFTGTDRYEFILVKVTNSDNDKVEGRYNIYRNGALVANGVAGKTYGLSQSAGGGHYFKFYAGTGAVYAEKWHFSFYLDYRFDCGNKRTRPAKGKMLKTKKGLKRNK
ncbi:MAG: hypothetical protein GY940_09970 [bacterium]|nr:hypothetical protein [bacterium]